MKSCQLKNDDLYISNVFTTFDKIIASWTPGEASITLCVLVIRCLQHCVMRKLVFITFSSYSLAQKNPSLAVPPNPFLTQFLPTILLWSFAAILPAVVSWSSYFEAHWTRLV